jgi:nucleoside-diphosphate-sugar epimerase
VDAVVHLAAISNDPMGNSFEKVTKDINDESSAHLARLAKQAGVARFVFASSCSMYGFAEGGPRKEDDALNPLTAYARSKVATEKTLHELATKDFVVTSLRFATACGMSERLRLDLVLNDFVAGAVAAQQITILSDGTPWRPLIHIEDMARAIEWAVGRELSNGGAFLAVNTGSNEWNYQVKDLAYAVAKVIPDVSVSINKNAQPDKRSYQVDFSLFRKLAPRHQPKVDLVGAIQGLKAGLERMRFADGNFRNSQFMRLKVLTQLREIGALDEQLRWSQRRTALSGTLEQRVQP